ncbi:hypothetical protein BDV95DRAFT_598341 [Massariosphaeria phaeospora]|uniref:Uncharacterized protein n=1 Tax=Massariosphaeria phaeospora TaxID=100035 RepID=A0A7C8I8S7_9PLEO|nr:hypothetical protein BDV95DRAFT_598341 [Massariosphaeria phaeospora]
MRYSVPKALTLGLLSTWLLCSNGNPVVLGNATTLSISSDSHLTRRAGGSVPKPPHSPGGSGPGVPPSPDGPDGTPGGGAGDPNEETPGFDTNEEAPGSGFDTCEKKRGWSTLCCTGCGDDDPPAGAPGGTTPGGEAPANNNPVGGLYPASARNNQNQPATLMRKHKSLEIYSRRMDFKTVSQEMGLPSDKRITNIHDILQPNDVDPVRQALAGTVNEGYFWAASSKAYAQACRGKIYVAIPEGQPINGPRSNNDGSFWWSFEAPALTRNPDVTEVILRSVDLDQFAVAPDKVIWRQGDEPLGFPGDEFKKEVKPTEPWDG